MQEIYCSEEESRVCSLDGLQLPGSSDKLKRGFSVSENPVFITREQHV